MSERIWEYLQAFAVLAGDLTINFLVTGMVPLVCGFTLTYSPWAWAAVLLLQLFLGLILLHHGTTWTIYLTVQGAAVAVEVVLACLMVTSAEYAADFRMWFGFVAAGVGMHAAYAAYWHPSANLIVGYVDITVVILFFYLYVEYYMGRTEPAVWAVSCASVVLDLAVVSHLRTEAENGHRISGASLPGKAVLLAIPVIFLIISGIAVGSASGQIHSMVDVFLAAAQKVWAVISMIITAFSWVLAQIILFFMRLLPDSRGYRMDAETPAEQYEMVIAEESTQSLPPWLMPVIIAICLAGLAIWGLYILRKTHVSIGYAQVKKRKVVKRSYLLSSILGLLKRAAGFLSFQLAYLCNKRTPQGLYLEAERRGAGLKVKKKGSESPGAYLRRLESELARRPDIPEETDERLLRLAGILDGIFYGGESVKLDREEYLCYARAIRGIR